jgi:hypothetical protein
VLATVSHRRELSLPRRKKEKSVVLKQRNQHARRVRYPNSPAEAQLALSALAPLL